MARISGAYYKETLCLIRWSFSSFTMSRRHDSDNDDEPEPFESSGDEWNVEVRDYFILFTGKTRCTKHTKDFF